MPRLGSLVEQARNANIGFNIDAEETDRLVLSMEVVERVLANRDLAGWDGFGVVVQAYSKQCLPVLRWVYALAETLEGPTPPLTIGELRDSLACGTFARVLGRINLASILARWPADTPLDRVAHELGENE